MRIPVRSRRHGGGGPEFALHGASVLTVATVLLAAWKLPPALLLPVTSVVLLLAGFMLALVVRSHPVRGHQLSYWDVAALLVFFGFGAAILSDTSALSSLFDVEAR